MICKCSSVGRVAKVGFGSASMIGGDVCSIRASRYSI